MGQSARLARVKALAKVNLGLKVLHRRQDGFHELRTVFQTISLADTLDLEFTPGRRTVINSTPEIPNNLVVRAAEAAFAAMRTGGQLNIRLSKKIPMGGGLGGGSSDAAAILLALPVLAGKTLSTEKLLELATGLGSDVPFFLFGGSAVAQGRGTELYGLPDTRKQYGMVVAPGVHVSTPEAYKALGRGLTSAASSNIINSFQAFVWDLVGWQTESGKPPVFDNDFESVVFDLHPRLKSLKSKLLKLGASSAMMSGSGSALFGLFETRERMESAREKWELVRRVGESAFPIQTVSRTQYQAQWLRSLAPHVKRKVWPPQSRCA